MSCQSGEQAADRAQRIQSETLGVISTLETDQAWLDEAADWFPKEEADLTRVAANRMRLALADLRVAENYLGRVNDMRRLRHEALRKPEAADGDRQAATPCT